MDLTCTISVWLNHVVKMGHYEGCQGIAIPWQTPFCYSNWNFEVISVFGILQKPYPQVFNFFEHFLDHQTTIVSKEFKLWFCFSWLSGTFISPNKLKLPNKVILHVKNQIMNSNGTTIKTVKELWFLPQRLICSALDFKLEP